MFQTVISTPISGSLFTGLVYDAFNELVKHISKNGLLDGDGKTFAALILVVLYIVPVIAFIAGLCTLASKVKSIMRFRVRKILHYVKSILFVCAVVDGLVACGIYYISAENFSLAFLANYIVPYSQKISFMTPAIWAAFYLIAAVFVSKPEIIYPYLDDNRYPDSAKSVSMIGPLMFGLGWANSNKKNRECDLDVSAFLFDM